MALDGKTRTTSCIRCGALLRAPASKTGRPAKYCGAHCRDKHEVALRRLRHRVTSVEQAIAHIVAHGSASFAAVGDRSPEHALERLAREVEIARAELHQFLNRRKP